MRERSQVLHKPHGIKLSVGRIVVSVVSELKAKYATVDDLARYTHAELEVRGRVSPGIDMLTALFRVMYAASMATEEGQSITLELTWIDPDNPDPDPPERVVPDRWTAVSFSTSIKLTTRALVKAAKATDPRTSSFAVYATETESVFIWGLIDQGNGPYNFIRYESSSGQDRPGVFQASVIGVGHLVISLEYEPIAEFRIARLSKGGLDPLRSGPVVEALRPSLDAYVDAVKAAVPCNIYEDREHWTARGLCKTWLFAGVVAGQALEARGFCITLQV